MVQQKSKFEVWAYFRVSKKSEDEIIDFFRQDFDITSTNCQEYAYDYLSCPKTNA